MSANYEWAESPTRSLIDTRIIRHPVFSVEGPLFKAGKAKEKSPQSLLIDEIRKIGGKATKITGEAGTPDVLAKVPGFPVILVEMKRDNEKPEPHQEIRRLEWEKVGVAATWCAGAAEVYAFMKLFK